MNDGVNRYGACRMRSMFNLLNFALNVREDEID